jgi:hypothetical protein
VGEGPYAAGVIEMSVSDEDECGIGTLEPSEEAVPDLTRAVRSPRSR